MKEIKSTEERPGLESLETWKAAKEFRKEISEITKTFPPYEQFRLKDQITRSVRSVSANIAEGYGRYHYKESMQSCRIARGSLVETLDHIFVARDEKYIDEAQFLALRNQYDHCLKLLNGYLAFLKNRKSDS